MSNHADLIILTDFPTDNKPERKTCKACRRRCFDGEYVGTMFPPNKDHYYVFCEKLCPKGHGRDINGVWGHVRYGLW